MPNIGHPKSPTSYFIQKVDFNDLTANKTCHVGVLPQSAKLVDVIVAQSVAGDGTSWAAKVKKNGTDLGTADGLLTAAIGANKALNTLKSPMSVLTTLSGCTRPAVKTDGTENGAAGDVITVDLTKTGTYTTGFSGSVTLIWKPVR